MNQYDRKDAILELFAMLKDSVEKDTTATEKLIDQQFELVTQLKTLPLSDLKEMLKDHATKAEKEIDECSGAIETKTNELMEKCKEIVSKLNRMFWAVGIAVLIMTSGYFVIRATVDNKATFESWKKEITTEREETIYSLKDEIIKEMHRLHSQDNTNDEDNN